MELMTQSEPQLTICNLFAGNATTKKHIDRGNQSCVSCGITFASKRKRKYCSISCQRLGSRKLCSNSCETCRVMFTSIHKEQRFCSLKCAATRSFTCVDCGLAGSNVGFVKRTRCQQCQKRRKNRSSSVRLKIRRGKAKCIVTKASVREVFDSSFGYCQLCAEPIDWSRQWPHRRSMSVDHIIPLSKGGNDQIGNLQAAHLGCNSSRGNRSLSVGGENVVGDKTP